MAEWNNKKCIVFGIEYNSIKEAQEKSYNKKKCKCEVCGKQITYEQWYQWCQRYLLANNGRIICHNCKSSENRIEMNKKYHNELSERMSTMNKNNWKNDDYREKKNKESSKRLLEARKDPNSSIMIGLNKYLHSKENTNKLLELIPKQMPHDEFFSENPRMYFELYRMNCQNKDTYFYIGDLYKGRNTYRSYKKLDGKSYFKLGITTNINARKKFAKKDSGAKKYHILRKFPNRRQAALCEYLCIEKFCIIGEASKIENLQKVKVFVKNFKYDRYKWMIEKYLKIYYPEDLD